MPRNPPSVFRNWQRYCIDSPVKKNLLCCRGCQAPSPIFFLPALVSFKLCAIKDYLVAGVKFGRATATFVGSQRVETTMRVSWTSHSRSLLLTLRHQFTDT